MNIQRPDLPTVYAYTGGRAPQPDLPWLVFVHGALNDHCVWTYPARWFAHHGWNVLALDLPGHGRSPGPVLPDVEACATWLRRLLADQGIASASIVGHSMGSLIGLEAAALAAASSTAPRIDRLVMVGTSVPMPVSDALLATSATDPLKAIDMVVAFAHARLAGEPGNPGPGTWHQGASRQLSRRILERAAGVAGCEHNLFHHDFSLCNRYARGLEAADAVAAAGRTRSHLLLARRDRMTLPKAAAEVGRRLGAHTHLLDLPGHDLMQEDPEGLLRALREALG
ncbi:alpha/beta fold hydrolase [Sphaerotilus microaerophilus]|uniref:Alpha/beta hydrolase n=1 Tax=Sphaerotilus microaerophilus TaxID=2914710 RepID=A0ABN6PI52_9BURK|nr:alpha/beta hydrolase [Sphaerotilus sp. FB-5]BDI04613.1 alpha/beta hydrolase [Sphaerotilus sp. FB-5]